MSVHATSKTFLRNAGAGLVGNASPDSVQLSVPPENGISQGALEGARHSALHGRKQREFQGKLNPPRGAGVSLVKSKAAGAHSSLCIRCFRSSVLDTMTIPEPQRNPAALSNG